MPKALERKLKRQAREKGFVKDGLSERGRKYVYGTLRKTGWVPSHQKKKRKMSSDTGWTRV